VVITCRAAVDGTDGGHCSLQGLCPPEQLQCGGHSPAESLQSASVPVNFCNCNCSWKVNRFLKKALVTSAALETAVLIGDTYSLTYDEVLTENVYQDPFEEQWRYEMSLLFMCLKSY
jgi:hypothetical protein